ncbi:hypothetical protein O3M35_012699 [Rhynocoris fuscipes]|uniref:Uncharacterized protein n=1 Tax=Rhynocoris fuscipes TaxID=488301 RepID=A0AAW1CUI9_9HEMI
MEVTHALAARSPRRSEEERDTRRARSGVGKEWAREMAGGAPGNMDSQVRFRGMDGERVWGRKLLRSSQGMVTSLRTAQDLES